MQSWEKQVLGHVNNVVDINMDGNWILDVLVINIDLDRRNIVVRKDEGNGPFMTLFNVSNILIKDKENRRPGKNEWNRQEML
jgi:hypothetical protein